MIKGIVIAVLSFVLCCSISAQETKLEVEGAVQIGNSEEMDPDPGTIRWTGKDFMGWNGIRWVSLTTVVSYDSMVVDIDGNEYLTIKIGSQEWMAENLRTSTYNTGSAIPQVSDDGIWSGLGTGAWCWYMNDSSAYEYVYGKLYNWFAVSDSLCPVGWHVPTMTEWNTLFGMLGAISTAGGMLKEAGTGHWISPNTSASNNSGFTGLPGARRNIGGSFQNLGMSASFWSSTSTNATDAWICGLNFDQEAVGIDPNADKNLGYSIRCLKD